MSRNRQRAVRQGERERRRKRESEREIFSLVSFAVILCAVVVVVVVVLCALLLQLSRRREKRQQAISRDPSPRSVPVDHFYRVDMTVIIAAMFILWPIHLSTADQILRSDLGQDVTFSCLFDNASQIDQVSDDACIFMRQTRWTRVFNFISHG